MGDFFDYLIFLILFKKNTYNYYLVKISRKKKKEKRKTKSVMEPTWNSIYSDNPKPLKVKNQEPTINLNGYTYHA